MCTRECDKRLYNVPWYSLEYRSTNLMRVEVFADDEGY